MSRSTVLAVCMTSALALTGGTAIAGSVATAPDDSWITVSGTVASVGEGMFTLDYGRNYVTVEMDDWDWFDEANLLNPGEKVTVYGVIDDDLYETRSIEASRVYVASRDTFYFASEEDEEDTVSAFYLADPVPEIKTLVTLSGFVESVDGREFTLDTGATKITVDTITMPYNPMDDVGIQKIEPGDRVTVAGVLDDDLFEELELAATRITSLGSRSGEADAS